MIATDRFIKILKEIEIMNELKMGIPLSQSLDDHFNWDIEHNFNYPLTPQFMWTEVNDLKCEDYIKRIFKKNNIKYMRDIVASINSGKSIAYMYGIGKKMGDVVTKDIFNFGFDCLSDKAKEKFIRKFVENNYDNLKM